MRGLKNAEMTEFLIKIGFFDYKEKIKESNWHPIIFTRDEINIHIGMVHNKIKTVIVTKEDHTKNLFKLGKRGEGYREIFNTITSDIIFKNFISVKIKDPSASIEAFGHGPTKRAMSNDPTLYYKIHKVLPQYKCGDDQTPKDVVELYDHVTQRNYKFLASDLEFMFPNLDNYIKGYIAPLDRTIKKGVIATVRKKNAAKLSYGTKVYVQDTIKMSTGIVSGNRDCSKVYCKVVASGCNYLIEKNKLTVRNNTNNDYSKKAFGLKTIEENDITF